MRVPSPEPEPASSISSPDGASFSRASSTRASTPERSSGCDSSFCCSSTSRPCLELPRSISGLLVGLPRCPLGGGEGPPIDLLLSYPKPTNQKTTSRTSAELMWHPLWVDRRGGF